MKKVFKITAAILLVATTAFNANAQFNAGIDIALPVGDLSDAASLGYGISVGYEHKLGDKMGVAGELGYLIFSTKEPDGLENYSSSMSMIPILGNFKYYFSDNTTGAYGKAILGMSLYKYSYEYELQTITGFDSSFNPIYSTISFDDSVSKTYLTYGLGGGFLVNETIDVSVEYRIVDGDGGTADYICIGGSYNF